MDLPRATATCDTCKAELRWDEDGQEWLDRTGFGLCASHEYEDIHTVLD